MSSTTSYQRFRMLPVARYLTTWWSIYDGKLCASQIALKKAKRLTAPSQRGSFTAHHTQYILELIVCGVRKGGAGFAVSPSYKGGG